MLFDLLPDPFGLEPAEISGWIPQTIGMIHPQALGFSIPEPSENQLVCFPEDLLKFCPDRRQAVDIKESTVVDFVRRYPPESRAVGLFLEKGIQEIKAARVSRPTVKNLDRLFKSIPDLRAFPVQGRYALFDDLFFPVALFQFFEGCFRLPRQISQGCQDALQFLKMRVFFSQSLA